MSNERVQRLTAGSACGKHCRCVTLAKASVICCVLSDEGMTCGCLVVQVAELEVGCRVENFHNGFLEGKAGVSGNIGWNRMPSLAQKKCTLYSSLLWMITVCCTVFLKQLLCISLTTRLLKTL